MKRLIVAAVLALSACGPASHGSGRPAVVSPLVLDPPPIYSLLGFRDRLSLTPAQVEALDSLAMAVTRQNAPAVDSLRAIADARPGRTRGTIFLDERSRPLLERVRSRNQEAAAAVQDLLEPAQREEVCALADRRREDRLRSRRGREQQRERERERERFGRRAAPADTALVRPLRGWPWCEPAGG